MRKTAMIMEQGQENRRENYKYLAEIAAVMEGHFTTAYHPRVPYLIYRPFTLTIHRGERQRDF